MSEGVLAVDLVSPLPPVRSGIADYSADLLPALGRCCDLRLVRLPGQPVAPAIAGRYPLVDASRLGEGDRLPLYQMGNNAHHAAVYELARRVPGVVTLHDVVLHHFLIERTVALGRFEAYRQRLRAEHGWIGEAAARPLRWAGGSGNAAQFSLPAHRALLDGQRGVLVHSRWAAEQLREELGGVRVRPIPMGVPLGSEADAAAGRRFRRRHGIPEDAPLIGTFGFQTPMKRTDAVIRALARPRLAAAHLIVAGEVARILALEALARQLDVAGRVHFLGFLPFADFEAAIGAADLCLNLRYPTAGETSASLLRILAAGRGAVVSDHAQAAELPPDLVVRVPPGEGEEEALESRLAELLADRPRLARMGRSARRYVAERHAPERSAAEIVAACTEWRGAAPMALGPPRVPPPTSLTWVPLSGELAVEGAAAPWPAGERRRLAIRLANRSRARWLAAERSAGGIALEVALTAAGRNLRQGRPWIPLPRDLEPGQEHVFHLELRRPPGAVRLRVEPHALERSSLAELGGPRWEAEL